MTKKNLFKMVGIDTTITKQFSFAAAHVLPNYQGRCNRLHGHEWEVKVTIKGPVEHASGMVMDFGELKKVVEAHVINVLDHSFLNDTIKNPTAEHICYWIYDRLSPHLEGLESIQVWETKDSYATLTITEVESK